jgi:hypothetical protein
MIIHINDMVKGRIELLPPSFLQAIMDIAVLKCQKGTVRLFAPIDSFCHTVSAIMPPT